METEKLWAIALGLVIRELRKNLGLTQEQLGHAAGITRNHIHNVEHGSTSVALNTLVWLSNALGQSPQELLIRAGEFVSRPDLLRAAQKRLAEESKRGRPRK